MRADHRRGKGRRNSIIVALALLAGGGGLVAVNAAANATNTVPKATTLSAPSQTVSCPDVQDRLPAIPSQAKAEVDRNLALLEAQITEANTRIAGTQGQGGPNFINNAILGPLKDKRVATLDRIAIAIGRVADKPTGLEALAPCSLSKAVTSPTASASATPGANGSPQNGGVARVDGPLTSDFVDITKVAPNIRQAPAQAGASTGTFASRCGTNQRGQHNSDNDIVAPGVLNGAHHVHDYIGNKDVSAASTNESLIRQDTTCTNGDQSAYYWPVLRDLTKTGPDADSALGGGKEGNVGAILVPRSVSVTYKGSLTGKVVAMPQFLRIITGDAKAATNGVANANSRWTCTGFENKVELTDMYPLCPKGSKVVRKFRFQSCWDGRNIDSANHRSHVAFTDPDTGVCPAGFVAIPQLTMRLVYKVPSGPNYAVDGFIGQGHKAVTDHDDFIEVMSPRLMDQAVTCINSGRRCG
ncbi:DUF1996 domain-containing protein [Streptomyces sp. WM6386]|uniref:DUF1996 domain-containing protein n=1 Tax=Streptomyces sp. WM6386 TaxID=1415558 RepID=UPI000619FE67|nr:DUF1996 domain-containing protein [Streptomyces sp. WM6386]KKD03166.1 hypothetical protein TN53_36605 [Streptomyces sp. WM6386]